MISKKPVFLGGRARAARWLGPRVPRHDDTALGFHGRPLGDSNHTLSRKKPPLDLATCSLCVNTELIHSKYKSKQLRNVLRRLGFGASFLCFHQFKIL